MIATSPTGGDPGCAGAAVGTFTPGWCVGGNHNPFVQQDQSMLGGFSAPEQLTGFGSFLYLTDQQGLKVDRIGK